MLDEIYEDRHRFSADVDIHRQKEIGLLRSISRFQEPEAANIELTLKRARRPGPEGVEIEADAYSICQTSHVSEPGTGYRKP
jgi:hypothetical protein